MLAPVLSKQHFCVKMTCVWVCVCMWVCASNWACERCTDLSKNLPPPALLMPAGQFLLGRQDCISAAEIPPILFPASSHLLLSLRARDFTGYGLEHGTNLSSEQRIWNAIKSISGCVEYYLSVFTWTLWLWVMPHFPVYSNKAYRFGLFACHTVEN